MLDCDLNPYGSLFCYFFFCFVLCLYKAMMPCIFSETSFHLYTATIIRKKLFVSPPVDVALIKVNHVILCVFFLYFLLFHLAAKLCVYDIAFCCFCCCCSCLFFITSIIDNFLPVSFVDEELDKLFSTDLSSRAQNKKTEIYTRILSILNNGVVIGDKKFEFLAFSSSQLRENSL